MLLKNPVDFLAHRDIFIRFDLDVRVGYFAAALGHFCAIQRYYLLRRRRGVLCQQVALPFLLCWLGLALGRLCWSRLNLASVWLATSGR